MNDETIFDPKEVKQSPMNDGQKDETEMNNDAMQNPASGIGKKKKDMKASSAAGIGAAAGAVLGVLTPKLVFPNPTDGGDEGTEQLEVENQVDENDELNEVDAPNLSEHLTGHDMDVAHGVDDSMSFNQAFAAARHEVGPGGLFVWHGNTYGTYYANEWNAMSPEDKDQYWADVNHTTSHLEPEPEPQPEPDEPEPVTEPGDETGDESGNEPGDNTDDEHGDESGEEPDDNTEDEHGEDLGDEPDEPEPPTEPEDGETDEIEPELEPDPEVELEPEPEPLVLEEDDVIAELDLDGDGYGDAAIVDANDNEFADVVLDTTGDGSYDTLVIDAEVDDDGEFIVNEDNSMEIDGVEIEDGSDISLGDDDMPGIDEGENVDVDTDLSDDFVDDNPIDDNPDVDDFASTTFDPDVTIENDMDMSDFA